MQLAAHFLVLISEILEFRIKALDLNRWCKIAAGELRGNCLELVQAQAHIAYHKYRKNHQDNKEKTEDDNGIDDPLVEVVSKLFCFLVSPYLTDIWHIWKIASDLFEFVDEVAPVAFKFVYIIKTLPVIINSFEGIIILLEGMSAPIHDRIVQVVVCSSNSGCSICSVNGLFEIVVVILDLWIIKTDKDVFSYISRRCGLYFFVFKGCQHCLIQIAVTVDEVRTYLIKLVKVQILWFVWSGLYLTGEISYAAHKSDSEWKPEYDYRSAHTNLWLLHKIPPLFFADIPHINHFKKYVYISFFD